MLAAIPLPQPGTALNSEHYYSEELHKINTHLTQAEHALARGNYICTAWAFRSAFALLLEDFRRHDAVLPLNQRSALFARVCRAWQIARTQLPITQPDVVAMCGFIEGQRRRIELFACS